jgi:hypothetical protein
MAKKDIKTVMRQTNKWLLDLHKDNHVETVDFNILAVFIMQETDAKMHIRDLVATIIKNFAGSRTPQTNCLKPPLLSTKPSIATTREFYCNPTFQNHFVLDILASLMS